jgi:uncharacterized protein YndB with AHSA1/START domain
MPSIRRHIHIAASPRQVWKALTTAEGLESWLVDGAQIDARKDGRIVLTGEDDDGNPVVERGFIQKWRPTSHFEITWDKFGDFPIRGMNYQFQLAIDNGETRLSIVLSGNPEILDDDERRSELDADWRRALKSLQSMLDAE